ncbi:MAG: signal recognition particle-docking protein FtsY [Bacteroidetes bacterium]|nr:signal recognition particle-docking protein FtsY [Bacteroidota bacterium]
MNKFEKLKSSLQKTKKKLIDGLTEAITGKAVIDQEVIEKIEEILLSSDIGYDTTEKIITKAKENLINDNGRDETSIKQSIFNELKKIFQNVNETSVSENNIKIRKPFVYLIVGVNGVGKTTSIGKLAYNFKEDGKKVLIGAADTFRAAANEQLTIWSNRAGADMIQGNIGADPSSIAYKTVEKAIKDDYDVVFIDTAGRLHTKNNLMNELSKIKRAIEKILLRAPDKTLLVLDSTNGQNALIQAKEFNKTTELDGIILTKLDGTAKGGIVFQIMDSLNIPIEYIGIGEGLDDLQVFEADNFLNALLN